MSVSYDFNGKVALITGSSSGIGAATALLFAKSGAHVVVTGRNADHMKSVAKHCLDVSPNKSKPLEVVADVTQEEDLKQLVNKTIERFGKIDILVNNVGISILTDLNDPDYVEKYKRVMNTNLNSVVFLTHICVKYLEKTKGNIVNISSISSLKTVPRASPSCMSKAALDMFTKCIAVELGSKGIRVNSVNPGVIRTNFLKNVGIDKSKQKEILNMITSKYPVGRYGTGVDIANTVLYLASEQSSFITGSIVIADGGDMTVNYDSIIR